jgi:hypothetical protein
MKDLKQIPERFHVLFTDQSWNKGNESKMASLQRAGMNDLYLEYNNWAIKQSMLKPLPTEKPVGFIKD